MLFRSSWPGFLAVCVATALMASTFGLLIAALGRTPQATRGVAILAVLLMVMLGGAWVPSFVFPGWLQKVTLVIPARWAVDGLDAATWRGVDFIGVLPAVGVLLAFAHSRTRRDMGAARRRFHRPSCRSRSIPMARSMHAKSRNCTPIPAKECA